MLIAEHYKSVKIIHPEDLLSGRVSYVVEFYVVMPIPHFIKYRLNITQDDSTSYDLCMLGIYSKESRFSFKIITN